MITQKQKRIDDAIVALKEHFNRTYYDFTYEEEVVDTRRTYTCGQYTKDCCRYTVAPYAIAQIVSHALVVLVYFSPVTLLAAMAATMHSTAFFTVYGLRNFDHASERTCFANQAPPHGPCQQISDLWYQHKINKLETEKSRLEELKNPGVPEPLRME